MAWFESEVGDADRGLTYSHEKPRGAPPLRPERSQHERVGLVPRLADGLVEPGRWTRVRRG
eukprot:4075376-Pyramimonas_sp.AAC.1